MAIFNSYVKLPEGMEDMGVSWNRATPRSSILMWVSLINHPFGGTPHFRKPLSGAASDHCKEWLFGAQTWERHDVVYVLALYIIIILRIYIYNSFVLCTYVYTYIYTYIPLMIYIFLFLNRWSPHGIWRYSPSLPSWIQCFSTFFPVGGDHPSWSVQRGPTRSRIAK